MVVDLFRSVRTKRTDLCGLDLQTSSDPGHDRDYRSVSKRLAIVGILLLCSSHGSATVQNHRPQGVRPEGPLRAPVGARRTSALPAVGVP